ncbi:unnamed protein product [Ambrosiozyma monospora]|uniref:Unnamed protein product n=1 Tax=Ambrosiozyma monospora TaxID=43982 RepID=A0A9W6Z3Q6_AMBMO|nr:unnamed protein product [Ambrosiozyma monospora]
MLVVKRLIRIVPTQKKQNPQALVRLIHQQSNSDDLLQELSFIHQEAQKAKNNRNEMRKLRESNTEQGLATPSFSWDPGFHTEEQLLQFVLEKIPMDKLKDVSYPKVSAFWKVSSYNNKIEKSMARRGDWSIPSRDLMETEDDLIRYIKRITSKSHYRNYDRKMRFFDWLDKLLESYGDRIPLEGYALLIKNLAVGYEFARISDLMDHMKINNVIPDTLIYNTILKSTFKTTGENARLRAERILKEMIRSPISYPDIVTVNLILCGLSKTQNVFKMLISMDKCDIPLLFPVSLNRNRAEKIIPLDTRYYKVLDGDELRTSLLNYSISSFEFKQRNSFSHAYKYFKLCVTDEVVKPNVYTLKIFLKLIVSKEKNLPYAIAFFNHFCHKYGYLFKFENQEETNGAQCVVKNLWI